MIALFVFAIVLSLAQAENHKNGGSGMLLSPSESIIPDANLCGSIPTPQNIELAYVNSDNFDVCGQCFTITKPAIYDGTLFTMVGTCSDCFTGDIVSNASVIQPYEYVTWSYVQCPKDDYE